MHCWEKGIQTLEPKARRSLRSKQAVTTKLPEVCQACQLCVPRGTFQRKLHQKNAGSLPLW